MKLMILKIKMLDIKDLEIYFFWILNFTQYIAIIFEIILILKCEIREKELFNNQKLDSYLLETFFTSYIMNVKKLEIIICILEVLENSRIR